MAVSETQSTPVIEPLVDVQTVCDHVGFCRAKVTRMAKAGQIPAYPFRNGKRTYLRFKLSAVEAALSNMQTGPETSALPEGKEKR